MAKNMVQFQAGLSLPAFLEQYGSEDQCRTALIQQRWPKGFQCPECGHKGHCRLRRRDVLQCNRCKHQVSPTSGTLFAETKLPLRIWFLAIYLLTQHKNGISALALRRQLGVSYNTAWLLKHKLMQAMAERDTDRPLSGDVQIDDAYWGGERHGGGTGRGSPGKTPFVAAVQCTPEGHPVAMRMDVVAGFRKTELAAWARRCLAPGSRVVSDGLGCFPAIAEAGCEHTAIATGGGVPEDARFVWVNTVLGNVKNALHGTYHALRAKYLQRYLSEFCYRFNRRFDMAAMVPRLLYVAVRTPPLPYRLVTLDA
ncbi:IS1595 family transposase [Sphingobacterium siyangense]|uniref:IS1595 family transposase n=1 Tax=Sphingobacterium siyangense TaxID=459529 RepID=UPI003019BE9A